MREIDTLKALVEVVAKKFFVVFKNPKDIQKAKRLLIDHVRDILIGGKEKDNEIVVLFFDDIDMKEIMDSVEKVLSGAKIEASIRSDKKEYSN